MAIRLANNATAHLAAPLLVGDTTIVLVSGEVGGFPALSAGEYHPLTIVAPSGAREVVKVTARSGNILTVARGFEGTLPLAFDAGAVAEIRMTAGTIDQLQADTVQARTDMLAAMDTKDAALSASVLASAAATADSKDAALSSSVLASAAATADSKVATMSTSLQTIMDTKDNALHTTISAETAAAIAAIPAPTTAPVGAMVAWPFATEPTGWIFADGRTLLSSTSYTALRSALISASFPHGQDGSGNPKIPDMRGATAVGADNMGGTAAGRMTGATALGTLLGTESVTLTAAQLPAHTHTASTTAAGAHDHGAATAAGGGHTHTGTTDTQGAHMHAGGVTTGGNVGTIESGGAPVISVTGSAGAHSHNLTIAAAATHTHAITAVTDHTHPVTVNANTGGGGALSIVQPSRVLNWIVKT